MGGEERLERMGWDGMSGVDRSVMRGWDGMG
jgi:hypothetical protein